jgi:hypothetical protein
MGSRASAFKFAFVQLTLLAGSRPAASNFLLLRQEKVTKEKATPLSATLRCATGNLRWAF